MKKVKLLIVLVLIAAIIAAFIILPGCKSTPTTTAAAETTAAAAETTTAAAETTAAAAETTAAAGAKKWKVAVSLPLADNAWQASMLTHLQDETKNDPNIDWTIKNAADNADQTNTLTTFKDGGYDVIMCLPGDGTLQTSTLNSIYDAGIPVFIIDRAIENDKYTCFLADDNYDTSVKGMDFIGNWFKGQENIKMVNFRSYTGIPIDLQRYNGLVDTLKKYPNIKIIGEGDGEFNSQAGYKAMSDLLAAHSAIDVVYSQDDEAVLGALKAINEAGRKDIKLIVGVGFTKATVEALKADNTIHKASTTYSPYIGAEGAKAVRAFLDTGKTEKDIIKPSILITKDNVDQYIDQAYGN